jgi:lipid II:glycine glycyltransferase (peptidoglycan interpeptide bridge formation enzyme)
MPEMNYEYISEIDHIGKGEWSNLLLEFDDATIYQTWSYGAVRWGEKNLSHFVLKRNDEIIGAAQIILKKFPYLKAGIAYIPWGPLWKIRGREERLESFHHLLKSLQDEYVSRRGLMLRINPHIYENDSSHELSSVLNNGGFRRDTSLSPYRTFLVDLTTALPDIRKKLDQKWRNQLNRAEKNGLKIVEGNEDKLYLTFLNLQGQMIDRKKYKAGVDYNEFREIQRDLPDALKMRIIICESEGEPVTATIASAIGNTGIYLLGATGDKGLKLKGSYLLQWRTIEWLKQNGYRWYDLGGINPEKNPGVYQFKAGLSGNDILHIGQFEYWTNPASFLVVNLWDRFKNIVLKMKRTGGKGSDPRRIKCNS